MNKITYRNRQVERASDLEPDVFLCADVLLYRLREMRGNPLGRSWPWAVSMTMGQSSTRAAQRVPCPHGRFVGKVLCQMVEIGFN